MSIEGPEAHILAGQLHDEIVGRRIVSREIGDVARLQRSGFVNRDLHDFDRLIGGRVNMVMSRGATIRIALDNDTNLIIGPEYGGRILLHTEPPTVPSHLVVGFDDGRWVSGRLTGMGSLRCEADADLARNYVYRRDFSTTPDPITDPIDSTMFDHPRALKGILVGKDATVVGIANSAFQDICFRAGLHPKRRGTDLAADERSRLVRAVSDLIEERLRAGGKTDFADLYGVIGRYEPAMGPSWKNRACAACGNPIESIALGGGRVYYCPSCQT
jgi:formamidopyrimidine-DNA glycosylase